MTETEKELFNKAVRKFGRIQPCEGKTFLQCFFYQNGTVQFWFNDKTGNTRLILSREKILS